MQFSYNWLQKHFEQKLPTPAEIEDGVIFHSFEVEGIEKKADDSLLEIKILPDRAHDCLCHEGVAREISAIFKLPLKNCAPKDTPGVPIDRQLEIKIADPKLCRRYIGRLIEGIKVGESPAWLREKLEGIGQRSINNIVDATNYVLFDLGQPMHAFDADKVIGKIVVRLAKDGETITTLDNRVVNLNPSVLVITDDVGPLAIAGIKGGNRAEVDANTKNIILESANFDPVNIRKTSAKIGIRTEASKRYENELTQELALPAMDTLTELLSESAVVAGTKIGAKIDIYPTPAIGCQIKIRPAEISSILGVSVPEEAMIDILERLDIKVEKNGDGLNLEIPFRRIDLAVKENIMEEVGRIYGYDKIGSQLLDLKANKLADPVLEKKMRVADKIKEILVGVGFSEIYGYALVAKGDIELESPFASDKGFLRNNLADFINDRLAFNLPNNLFDNEPVKIFEIGQVFAGGGERASLCFGIAYKKQKKIKAEEVREEVSQVGANILRVLAADDFVWDVNISELPAYGQDCLLATVEVSLNELISRAGEFVSPDLTPFICSNKKTYKKIPAYPRVIRDVAVWVPAEVSEAEVMTVIKNSAGTLLFDGPVQFDRFEKDGRISLAFRQVFQSYDKTLSDEEVNGIMDKVIAALEGKGWEVRK